MGTALLVTGCSLIMPFEDDVGAADDSGPIDPDLRPDGSAILRPPDADPNAAPVDAVFVMPDAFASDAAIVRETMTLPIVRDTFVRESNPTFNYGAQAYACADMPGDARVGLLQPSLTLIPAGAIVESAALHLWIGDRTNDYSIEPYTVYEVQEAWNEGNQDAAAGNASWTNRQAGTAWASPGVGTRSRGAAAVGGFTPLLVDSEYAIAIDPALVNRWVLDPTTNHGVAIVASGIDGACWVTTEGTAAKVPTFVVTWRLPSADGTL